MLSAEGIMSASSSWRSVRRSPATTSRLESPFATACTHASWSAAVIVNTGPDPSPRGWSLSTMTAVITFVTLAMGTEASFALAPSRPTPRTKTADSPTEGKGRDGRLPAILVSSGTIGTREGSWT